MEHAGWIAIGVFMVGVIFKAGQLTSRVDALERQYAALEQHLSRIERLIVGQDG
jgi:hypothetical protein